MKNTRHQPKRQSGTALITVVLIAAVVIVLVIESVKSLRFQKQLSSNLINRDQAYSYLMGMEELAKIWLKKAFENSKEDTVNLNQSWAQENITFPLEGGGMTASIKDMQSCYNLNSIAEAAPANGNRGGDGNRDENDNPRAAPEVDDSPRLQPNGAAKETPGQLIITELYNQVNKNTEITGKALAAEIKDWIDVDIEPSGPDGAEDDYYQSLEIPYRTANGLIAHTSELRAMRSFNQDVYTLLLPYICVLPDPKVNQINVNTVSQESGALIYAALGGKGSSLSEINSALSSREEEGYESVDEFIDALGETANNDDKLDKTFLGVTSHYFEMSARAEIGKTRVAMKTLFKRDEKNNFKVISRYFGKE